MSEVNGVQRRKRIWMRMGRGMVPTTPCTSLPLIWPAASLSLLRPSGSGPDCWTWFGLESHSRSRTHLLLDVKEVSTLLGAETRRTAEMG